MINFNKRNVNIISLLISSVIFVIIVVILNYPIMKTKSENMTAKTDSNSLIGEAGEKNNSNSFVAEADEKNNSNALEERTDEKNNSNSLVAENDINVSEVKKWTLEIKSLNLNAPIKQLDSNEPNDDYIGHFSQTSISKNNIALIAYNFGKDNNYFANLKDLKVGDEIIYTVNEDVKKYEVIFNKIIEKDDINNYLQENNEPALKLFTYVKDLSTKMRYVGAK